MKKYWYAAQKDTDDEWGNGSYDLDEAKKIARDYRARGYENALVAVIDEGADPICVDEINDID